MTDPGVQRLALAVLRLAAEDARGGDTMPARQARAWLQGGGPRLRFWCDAAGLSAAVLRERIAALDRRGDEAA